MDFFSTVARRFKKPGNAIRGFGGLVANGAKDLGNRIIGSVDILSTLVGILPKKKLRLRVVILHKEDNAPVALADAVMPSIERAREIFMKEANIEIVAAEGVFVESLGYPAPAYVLNIGCNLDAVKEDLGEAGVFFRKRLARSLSGSYLGSAGPITAYIVENIRGYKGCSLGAFTDYVTVDVGGLKQFRTRDGEMVASRVLAHELAHACGLLRSDDTDNLAHTSGPGTDVKRLQRAVLRNSRHVTYM